AFQFSFSATAGLLLFMPLMDQMLTWLIVPRRLRILIHMPMSEQIAYVLLTYLRKATALSLAVNLSTGPLILYHLHKIPWIGLFFNLFYPLCIALALGWLVLNLVLGLSLPPIADIFFKGLSVFTDYLVHIVSDVPLVLLGELYAENIASSFLLAWYGLLCCAGVVAACQSQRWKKTALWTIA
ncbi:MAG: ComEC/Rec2 family competence protein, partial [Chlamydiia bacterium]|nr:ComEC/Rec2 family competence protein [Chlamydiia bacterium]